MNGSRFILAALLWAGAFEAQGAEEASALATAQIQGEDPNDAGVIVVTGSRRAERLDEATTRVDVIDEADIKASGAMNLGQLLAAQPGIQLTQSFAGTGVQIRGLDAEYVLILINGERVNGRLDGVLDLSRLTVDGVERVEIVKGASSALYGSNAMGGVINIITSEPQDGNSGRFMLSYGSLNAVDGTGQFSHKKGPRSLSLRGGYHRVDAWDLDPENEATTGSAFTMGDGKMLAQLELLSLGELEFRADYMQRRSEGVDQNAAMATFDRVNLVETYAMATQASLFPTENDHLNLELSYSRYRDQYLSDQRGSDALDVYENTVDQIVQGDLQWDHETRRRDMLTVGAEVIGERIETSRVQGGLSQRLRGAAFAQGEWRSSGGNLALVPGMRLDADSQFGLFFTPKFSGRLDLLDDLALRGSVGQGYRAPDFKELYLTFENPGAGYRVDGNAGLSPETSLQADGALTFAPNRHLSVEAGVFRTQIQNMITVALVEAVGEVDSQSYTYVNIGSALLRGAESALSIQGGWGGQAKFSYMFLDSLDEETDAPLEGRSRHQVSTTLRYQNQDRNAGIQVRGAYYSAPSYWIYDPAQFEEVLTATPAYTLVDARLSKGFLEHYTCFISALNLFNAGDPTYLPIQPRTLRLGVEGVF